MTKKVAHKKFRVIRNNKSDSVARRIGETLSNKKRRNTCLSSMSTESLVNAGFKRLINFDTAHIKFFTFLIIEQ